MRSKPQSHPMPLATKKLLGKKNMYGVAAAQFVEDSPGSPLTEEARRDCLPASRGLSSSLCSSDEHLEHRIHAHSHNPSREAFH